MFNFVSFILNRDMVWFYFTKDDVNKKEKGNFKN